MLCIRSSMNMNEGEKVVQGPLEQRLSPYPLALTRSCSCTCVVVVYRSIRRESLCAWSAVAQQVVDTAAVLPFFGSATIPRSLVVLLRCSQGVVGIYDREQHV
jgi:hypothetical protein